MFGIRKVCSRWLSRQAHQQREIVILRMEQIEMNMIRELSELKKEVVKVNERLEKFEQKKA